MALTKIDDRGLKTPIDLLDNEKIRFGTGNDLTVWHNGTNSYIQNTTGDLFIESGSDIFLYNGATNEYYAKFIPNGATELYFDNSKKFETTSVGGLLTGKLEASNGFWCKDNATYRCGDGTDLMIYHDGTDSIISNATNVLKTHSSHLFIRNAAGNEDIAKFVQNGSVELYYDNVKTFQTSTHGIQVLGAEGQNAELLLAADEGDDNADNWRIKVDTNGQLEISNYASGSYEKNIECNGNGNVELYYDNSKKFHTHSTGVTVTGYLHFEDGSPSTSGIGIGNSDDLKIYHDGSSNDSYIDTSTGNFYIRTNGSENAALFIKNAGARLYHNDVQKFETTAAGVTVSGTVTDSKGDLRKIPANTQGSAYTLVAGDAGKFINASGNITVPPSVFAVGEAITIYNSQASTALSIIRGTGVSVYNAADATDATRTLAGRGIATLLNVGTDTFVISGAGLS